ncbi:MAG: hypothetical protein GOMPHAMPRED_007904 [Gomphillus americanus]|uniref:Uncharacterized protein n=1 Tax=Gomphillus americanus TaxID=1940652 RepID=A0A8H3ICK5_9LECA|nr:MAG: hypothetical protein GOMPHAMPRED_007904 [Gomphillus americanus]
MSSTESEAQSSEDGASSSKPQHKSRLGKTKRKVKKLITRGIERVVEQDHTKDPSLAITNQDPAFHPDLAAKVELEHGSGSTILQKTKTAARSAVTALINPKEAAKQAAASKLASTHRPYTLPTNSKALLQAYDDVDSESSTSSGTIHEGQNSRRQTRLSQQARLQQLEAQRESMHVAWTLDHVDRVKTVVVPSIPYPERNNFFTTDASGKRQPDDLSWLGQFALWYTQNFTAQYIDSFTDPPFSTNTLRKHAERLIMASGPMQVWAMDIRSIYRWQNPKRTGRWLVAWLFIWHFEYVGSFFWACVFYHTIKSKFFPRSKEHLQASLERTIGREGTAFQFGEFIDRHGADDWLEPFLDQVGPYIQLQVNDLADFLEILTNFYMWRSPSKTLLSLTFVASCLAVSVLTDLRFAYKIIWFIVGGAFFFCWPIASRYPRYRLLVSGFRWTLWEIPTNSEWGFDYLRQQCEKVRKNAEATKTEQRHDDAHVQLPVNRLAGSGRRDADMDGFMNKKFVPVDSPSGLPRDFQLLSFRCRFDGTRGKLELTPEGLHFIRSIKHKCLWTLHYQNINEMRKHRKMHELESTASSKSGSKRKDNARTLELQSKDNKLYTLEFKSARDEAFNYIIGFSRVQWKSLQS